MSVSKLSVKVILTIYIKTWKLYVTSKKMCKILKANAWLKVVLR